MSMIKLTNPTKDEIFYVNSNHITAIERHHKYVFTMIYLSCGNKFICVEPIEEVFNLINHQRLRATRVRVIKN